MEKCPPIVDVRKETDLSHSGSPRPAGHCFPSAVVRQIVSFCGPTETLILAALSRRWNKVVTSHALFQSNIVVQPVNAVISIDLTKVVVGGSKDWISLIPHLLVISFWIQSVRSIRVCFGLPSVRMGMDIGHIAGFIARCSSHGITDVSFSFEWVDGGSLPAKTGVNMKKWEKAMANLTAAVRSEGVKHLHLTQMRKFQVSDAASETNPLGFHDGTEGFRTIHVDCPFLRLPECTHWTINLIMFNFNIVTSLSLFNCDLDPSAWGKLLAAIRLPNLASFTIRADRRLHKEGANASDLVYFLDSHPTITHFNTYGMGIASVLTRLAWLESKKTLLPRLSRLIAPAPYITLIVNSHTINKEHPGTLDTPANAFRSRLESITIEVEIYTPQYASGALQYTLPQDEGVLECLKAVSSLPTDGHRGNLQLGFRFDDTIPPDYGGANVHWSWIPRTVAEGEESVCTRLYGVGALSLVSGKGYVWTRDDLVEVLPALFNLFPALGRVKFTFKDVVCEEGMERGEIEGAWRRKCPRLESFELED